jgi:c-di-GMP-related signal transduction protein
MPKTEALNRFLARQPILTARRKLFGYEILSRYGPENYCRPLPGSPLHVINTMDELFLMGIQTMTEGVPAFVNCTREFLVSDFLTLMPKETVIGEILETVLPDAEVMAACRRMKQLGYRLALDDYCDSAEGRQLMEVADFVRIDVPMTSFAEQERLVGYCHERELLVLAEKVETDEHFKRCQEIGYDYFQGYFFCRPQIVGRRSVPANKRVYLELLRAANEEQFNLQKIGMIFKRDVSLSYRLLRYLNSAAFAFPSEIHSIPHALMLLGERAMRKWISLVSVAALGDSVSDDLLRLPLLRAMFCELIGQRCGIQKDAGELFLMGLLSVMDVLLNMRMIDVLKEILVGEDIKKALLGQGGTERYLKWCWTMRLEHGSYSRRKRIKWDCTRIFYRNSMKSVKWVGEVLAEAPVAV